MRGTGWRHARRYGGPARDRLAERARGEALVLGDGAFVLVHKESLDDGAQLVATAMGKDGKQRWSRPLGGPSVEGSILAGGNVVIVLKAARGGLVLALSQKTGEIVWRYAT